MFNLFASKPPRGPAVTARLKAWVGDLTGLGDGATIMVAELRCHDLGCPDLETVITVVTPDQRRFVLRFPKPVAEIGLDDFSHLMDRAGEWGFTLPQFGDPDAPMLWCLAMGRLRPDYDSDNNVIV